MSEPPTGKYIPCPECDETATAVIPANGDIVETAAEADGKVWVTCFECDGRFLVHFRTTGE